MQPFVTERSKTYEKKNAQFRACQKYNRPLVTITPRGKFAVVEVDMFTTDKNFDDSAMWEISAAFAEHTAVDNIKVSAIQCIADRVPRGSAESLATKLYDTAVAAMPYLPPAVAKGAARSDGA
jgi:hypothetical protein